MTYNITYYVRGKTKVAKYATLEKAKEVAKQIFQACGVVVGIEAQS